MTTAELERQETAEELATPRGLYVKLAEVVGAIGRVEKNGRNEFHKYDYVKEDDLLEAVRGLLTDRQVLLLPSVTHREREGNLTTIDVRFTFVDAETGQTHGADWSGTGEDKGDKGLYKAYTGAVKYFLLKAFLIPTGNDPDESGKQAAARKPAAPDGDKPITKTQREQLIAARDVTGITDTDWSLKLNTYGASDETDLTRAQGRELYEWVKVQAVGA